MKIILSGSHFSDNPRILIDLVLPWLQDDLLEDVNYNETKKPSMSFLDIHHQGASPERSPGQQRKPYVPPLDLSILHEHGDGNGEKQLLLMRRLQGLLTHTDA